MKDVGDAPWRGAVFVFLANSGGMYPPFSLC